MQMIGINGDQKRSQRVVEGIVHALEDLKRISPVLPGDSVARGYLEHVLSPALRIMAASFGVTGHIFLADADEIVQGGVAAYLKVMNRYGLTSTMQASVPQ